jgi:hypothetical protein
MHIYVDADAFPRVIQEILFRAIERVRVPLVLVSNKHVKHPKSDLISRIVAGEGPASDTLSLEKVVGGIGNI